MRCGASSVVELEPGRKGSCSVGVCLAPDMCSELEEPSGGLPFVSAICVAGRGKAAHCPRLVGASNR